MKTSSFYDNYNAIKFFCQYAKNGFIVVETNNEITKEEFLQVLSADFYVKKYDFKLFDDTLKHLDQKYILLIDEFETNSDSIVVDLNYNRNWFLSLERTVIFILKPSTVNKLIRYSASFWSFVALHKVFSYKFRSILQPHFIADKNDWNMNGLIRYSKDFLIENSSSSKNKIIGELVFEVFKTKYSNQLIEDFINKYIRDYVDGTQKSLANFIFNVLLFTEKLIKEGFYKQALQCLELIERKFTVNEDYIELEIRRLKLLADVHFSLKQYSKAYAAYDTLCSKISESSQKCNTDFLALCSNNLGVIWYKENQLTTALECLNQAMKFLNESDTDNLFVYVNVLYNASLVNYKIGDYNNSFYYIDSAIESMNNTNMLKQKIMQANCQILKSYLMINSGDLIDAEDLLHASLACLRENLDEYSIIIMEAHYIFSVLFLHKNDLEHAESCALKAYKIMKSINPERIVRCHIRELLGEIYFYKREYDKAAYYLRIAYNHSYNKNFFTDEILEWMKQTIKDCESIIQNN